MIIDCDAYPFVPEGWSLAERRTDGQFDFDPAQVRLHLPDDQFIRGDDFRTQLATMPLLNANVLDFLLVNPDLIPEDWKYELNGRWLHIFFWGTIYRDPQGELCVRCLTWQGRKWIDSDRRVETNWNTILWPALVRSG